MEAILYSIFALSIAAFASAEPWSASLLQISIAIFVGLSAYKNRLRTPGPVQKYMGIGFACLAFVGMLQLVDQHPANYPNTSLFFTASPWWTRKISLLMISYAGLCFSTPSSVFTRAGMYRCSWVIFGAGILVAVVGLGLRSENTALLLGFRPLAQSGAVPFGPFVNRDHAATFLAIAGLGGWGLLFASLREVRNSTSMSRLLEHLAKFSMILFMISFIVICLARTGSRGGMHAFLMASYIVSVAAIAAFSRGWRRIAQWLGLASLVMIYIYWLIACPEWRGFQGSAWLATVQVRRSLYQSGLQMLGDFFMTGTGLGSVRSSFHAYQQPMVQGTVEHVHSDWLEFLLQAGLPGLLSAAIAFGCAAFVGFRAWFRMPTCDTRALRGGAIGALVALMIHMCVDFPFQIPAIAMTAILGACIADSRHANASDSISRRRGHRIAKTIAVCGAAIVVFCSFPTIVAEWFYYRGRSSDPMAMSYFVARALRWDSNPRYAVTLARTYGKLSEQNPAARTPLLRAGLQVVGPSSMQYPLDVELISLRENYTWALYEGGPYTQHGGPI